MPKKIDAELRARAVRLVTEHRGGVSDTDRRSARRSPGRPA